MKTIRKILTGLGLERSRNKMPFSLTPRFSGVGGQRRVFFNPFKGFRCFLNAPRVGILVAIGVAAGARAGNITVKGSDTLVILAQKWAEVYMSKHPEVKIQVTGGGSGIGFAALQNNKTDIADASWPIKAAEKAACIKAFGKAPKEYKVALDGLSVYVHSHNTVSELSLEQ